MQYKYVKEQLDYSDFASGRVFYSMSGHPAFPVRLASEIFQRCVVSRKTIYNNSTPCTLYDPCCGAAYHLSVLAYLHREHIREVIGSDIDEKAVTLANQNLGLLGVVGLDKRISEISKMFELYNKDSHKDALASGYILKDRISALAQEHPLITKVFQTSATDSKTIMCYTAQSLSLSVNSGSYTLNSTGIASVTVSDGSGNFTYKWKLTNSLGTVLLDVTTSDNLFYFPCPEEGLSVALGEGSSVFVT